MMFDCLSGIRSFHRSFSLTVVQVVAWTGFALHASSGQAQQAQNFIVSDLDDTVKITDVAHSSDALINAMFSRKVFAGMSTLFREVSHANGNSTLYFVTGSPTFFRKPIVSLVVENHFPSPWMLLLRKLSQPTPEFKVEKIKEILQSIPEDAKLLLFGDDGEQDPETYATLLKDYSSRVSAVYIHRVKARELPPGEIAYDTAMDIAVSEMDKGRMSVEQALRIGNAVLSEGKDEDKLVMQYNFCPTSFDDADRSVPRIASAARESDVTALSSQIHKKIKQICEDRAKDAAQKRDYPN